MNEISSQPFAAEAPARFTVSEFMALATQPPLASRAGKIELVDGVITHMGPAGYPHFGMQRHIFLALHGVLGAGIDGWIAGQELTLQMPGRNVREPDLCIFREPAKRNLLVKADAILLAIEVADTSLKEGLGPKQASYAKAGVPHYWVVDINARQVHLMADPDGGTYRTRYLAAFEDALTLPLGLGTIHLA
jgi:Uma2 family endonuclease